MPEVSYAIHQYHRPQCFATRVKYELPQVGHVSNWRLIHTILHHGPYLIVNWIKIRAIRSLEGHLAGMNRSSTPQQLDRLMGMLCWRLIHTINFCRVMRCISTAYAVMRCLCVCPSVRLSRSWIMWKRINLSSHFSPSGSHTILVFPYQTGWRYSDGNPPNGGVECRWGRQKRDSGGISGFIDILYSGAYSISTA